MERKRNKTYVEYRLRLCPAGVCVLLAQRDEFFGEALRLFGFVPGRLDGFVRDERGDEVAEEGLPVRGGAVQVPVFQGAAGHCDMRWEEVDGERIVSMDWCVRWRWERVGFDIDVEVVEVVIPAG